MRSKIALGNSMIAELIGGEVKVVWKIQYREQFAWYGDEAKRYRKEFIKINIGECILDDQLEFHLSFDWIKPAVQTVINAIEGEPDLYPIYFKLTEGLIQMNIEEVWGAVVEYCEFLLGKKKLIYEVDYNWKR